MPFGVSEGLAAGGAFANLLGGRSQAKASKEMLRRQAQFADLQNQQYRQTMPVYNQLIQQMAGRAGLTSPGGVTQTGENRFSLGAMPGQRPTGMGSNWGTPEDQLRLQAAEEDINRYYRQQANQLQHQLGGQGIASGSIAAALGRNVAQQGQQLGQFRRGLAINAGQEQERRLQALLGALGPGMGAGAQAANIYGQQGAMAGQQAAQSFGDIGNVLQGYQYGRSLQQGTTGTMDPYSFNKWATQPVDPSLSYTPPPADTYGWSGSKPIYDPATGRIVGYG